MNNEPVAWMVAEMVFDSEEAAIAIGKTYDDEVIPLYTHPVKELTDDEILEVAKKMGWRGALGFLINFARAILKKASEK